MDSTQVVSLDQVEFSQPVDNTPALEPGSRMEVLASAWRQVVAAGNKPCAVGNTHTENSQSMIGFGFDWIDLSCYGDFESETRFDIFLGEIAEAKRAARDGMTERAAVRLAGSTAAVTEWGGGHKAAQFEYMLKWRGLTVKLSNRQKANRDIGDSPNLMIEVPGRVWLVRTLPEILEDIEQFFRAIGYKPNQKVATRADLTFDVCGAPVTATLKNLVLGRYVSRARNGVISPYFENGKCTSYVVQSRAVRYTCYDKLHQLKKKQGKGAVDEYFTLKTDGVPCEIVTRHEFSLRKDALQKYLGIQDLETLLASVDEIMSWLMEDWLRMTKDKPTKDNTARCKASKQWRKLLDDCLERIPAMFAEKTPRKVPTYNRRRNFLTMAGFLMSEAILSGRQPDNLAELFQFAYEGAERFADEINVTLKAERKRKQLASRGVLAQWGIPDDPLDDPSNIATYFDWNAKAA